MTYEIWMHQELNLDLLDLQVSPFGRGGYRRLVQHLMQTEAIVRYDASWVCLAG